MEQPAHLSNGILFHMIVGGPRPVQAFTYAARNGRWVLSTGLAHGALPEIDPVARRP